MKKHRYLFLIFFVFMSVFNANAHEGSLLKNFSLLNFDDIYNVKSDLTLLDSNVVIQDTICVGYPFVNHPHNINYYFSGTFTQQIIA
jgi:hypothetical protein